jgi:hypothetical protein
LLGSAAWVRQPTLPLDKAVAMINMDMIGRVAEEHHLHRRRRHSGRLPLHPGKGVAHSGLKPKYSESGYSSSDHTSFVVKQIPVLFFFSGLHSDYHKPSDTWDKIDPKSAVAWSTWLPKPAFISTNCQPDRRLSLWPSRIPPASGIRRRRGIRSLLRLDSRLWAGGDRSAILRCAARIAGCQGRTQSRRHHDPVRRPAHQESLRLQRCAAPRKVGDLVEVTVLRDGKPLKVKVTLEQRR